MSRLIAMLATSTILAVTAPAKAQSMQGMNMPGMSMPMQAKKKPAAKVATKGKPGKARAGSTKPKTGPALKRSARPKADMTGMDHGAMQDMDHSVMPGMGQTSPQGAQQDRPSMPGMQMPASDQPSSPAAQESMQRMDHSAMPGMSMPGDQGGSMQAMPGMASMPGMAMEDVAPTGTALPAGNAAPPPLPTDHAADRIYGPDAMAMGRHHLTTYHGGQNFYQVLVNVAEYQAHAGRDGYRWDGEAWYGGDINRFWLKSEGEGEFRRQGLDSAEVQALYSRAVGPYFNLQAGVRYDFKPNPSRAYATVGVEGLAPGLFELEAAAFLSNKGEVLGRVEGYYDQRVTQRLILQPRAEFNLSAQNVPELRTGSGLVDAEVGLRLRYEVRREFAPYIGVSYLQKTGATARYARAAGEDVHATSFVVGLRTWF